MLIWGQGCEVTFVTVPGMDERWCQHVSNVGYTQDVPVGQGDLSPHHAQTELPDAHQWANSSQHVYWAMPFVVSHQISFEFMQT